MLERSRGFSNWIKFGEEPILIARSGIMLQKKSCDPFCKVWKKGVKVFAGVV